MSMYSGMEESRQGAIVVVKKRKGLMASQGLIVTWQMTKLSHASAKRNQITLIPKKPNVRSHNCLIIQLKFTAPSITSR
jgi:hypothetical protein